MGIMDKLLNRRKPKAQKRALKNLRVGDIVSYDLTDYTAISLIKYEDSGYKWVAYQLEGEGERIWLAVEQGDTLEISIFKPVKLDIGNRPPNRLNYDNKTFYLNEAGTAAITGLDGETGATIGQEIKYWEYEDKQEDFTLSIELWGRDLEVGYGYYINERELSIMAGS